MKYTTSPDLNEFFRDVTLRICGSLNIDEALEATAEYLKQFIPIDHAGMYYFVEEHLSVYGVAERIGPLNDHPDTVDTPPGAPLFTFTPEEYASIEADAPSNCHDADFKFYDGLDQTNPHYFITRKYLPYLVDYSAMKMTLRVKEDEIGMLALWAKGHHRYAKEHAHLLEAVREPFSIAMSNARRYQDMVHLKEKLADDNRAAYRDLERYSGNQVVGSDFGLRGVMELVHQVAPMTSPVLLLGETGTGKEVIANAIHMASNRRGQPFVRVQCGAIPEALLDSELFGHEKGAFTGAVSMKRGRFERAEGGTIFLDEIAELTPEAQVKLLRVLQEREFERLGGTSTLKADVRVIAATHRNLKQMIADGSFREDLWFRLNVFPVQLPPLRERKQDIPSLVQFFIERKSREMNLSIPPVIEPGTMEQLQQYDWPGNVRELQNIIERALILNRGATLHIPPLTESVPQPQNNVSALPTPETLALNSITTQHIKHVLELTNGRIEGPNGAAELLQINHGTLRARMKKLGIPFGRRAETYAR